MPHGCRALTDEEINRALAAFAGKYAARDRALFVVMLTTGLRISEALALRIDHILDRDGRFRDEIRLEAAATKGREGEREVAVVELTGAARTALETWLPEMRRLGFMTAECFLFQSQSIGNRALTRAQAWRILARAFRAADVRGKLGTHCLRKTFVRIMYEATGKDPNATSIVSRHKTAQALQRYMENDRARVAEIQRERFEQVGEPR